MAKRIINYFDFDLDGELACPNCGRRSRAGDLIEIYDELSDFVCPCGNMIAIVPHPTVEETKRAAAAGNPKAIAELDHALRVEARRKRVEELKLKPTDALPELDGGELAFAWDFEEGDDEKWTVIRCGSTVVHRELAVYEGQDRFDEVKQILKEAYGERFAELRPTQASLLYLYGDRSRGVSFT
jgi:hypothetical protein